MPTKGPSRAHESFRLATPAQAGAGDPDLLQLEEIDQDPDGWSDITDHDTPDANGGASSRTSRRTYRGELTFVEMENVTAIRNQLRDDDGTGFVEEVTVGLPDDIRVDLPVSIARPDFFYGLRRLEVREDLTGRLGNGSCSCGRDRCGHRTTAIEAVRALVGAERIRSGVTDWETTSSRLRATFTAAYQASVAARAASHRPEPDGPDWSADRTGFQRAYRAAKDHAAGGEQVVPYMIDNATDGLGARDGGRGFGVEIEFDVPAGRAALEAIGRDLHAAGITDSPHQTGYHQGRADFSRWRFERDCTVNGEIVSPILYDEPETWDKLKTVCDIVKRHGGQATMRTGGHVHVSVGDYDHTPENHQQLLETFDAHQDTLYRLSHNADQRSHRGTAWCAPNRVPSAPYDDSMAYTTRHGTHRQAVNFGAVTGRDTDHVEFRTWDGSLDPATIQTRIKLSLGLADHAFATAGTDAGQPQPLGSHRRTNRNQLDTGGRLRDDAWRDDTANFRGLMDRIFRRTADREQATALFAITRWQRP